jgi:predicted nuclease of predicted toxin-antitoxin system
VWHYAAEGGFTIVSKDADFHEHSFLLGHPPKVMLFLLQTAHAAIIRFEADPEASFLELG